MKKYELYIQAKELGIKNICRMNKAELAEAIRERQIEDWFMGGVVDRDNLITIKGTIEVDLEIEVLE